MRRTVSTLLLILVALNSGFAEETSFRRVKVPQLNGKLTKAVLTFSDTGKAMEVRPIKGDPVSIPYGEIDRCSYEFTRKHRIKAGVIVFLTVAMPAGVIVMFTRSRSHWLEIDYRDQDTPKALVLRMDKRDYIHILEALKAHTGIDAGILGNADKR